MLSSNKVFALLCVGGAATLTLYIHGAKTRLADVGQGVAAPESIRTEVRSGPLSPPAEEHTTSVTVAASAGLQVGPKPEPKSSERARRDHGSAPTGRSQRVFFRYNGRDSSYGQLAFVPLERPEAPQFIDRLSCEVAYVSGGRGICLAADRGVFTTYAARLFDANTFQILSEFPLNGVPSRSRVSADGRLAALTVFVSGHGYDSLDFSTQTLLVDVAQGKVIADLEGFAVTRDGQRFVNKDFNFWGVTFTPDAAHFYATLSTNRQHFLVKGNIASRSAVVVHANVECPSLSPDGTRVAYKKRLMEGNRVVWQLHVLDLKTRRETRLGERRSIDDQLEWLDNDHVLYAVPGSATGPSASTDIWKIGADGVGTPTLFLAKAYSPSVAGGRATAPDPGGVPHLR
jgi:hypothetical protein